MLRALMACSLLVLSACGGEPDSASPEKVTYAAALGVDLGAMTRSASGLYTQDVPAGTGAEATPGREVGVHYTGWLPDGTQFDSSRGGRAFWFTLGVGQVISGWDEGVAGMKVGGKRRLILPAKRAYGERGAPPLIPPHSVLVFDVELLGVQP
jgi:FKBP-type peptidyl-prolyl cis-trans isomerase FkpA